MTREEARQIIATWLVSSKGAKGQLGYIEGWFDEEDVEAFRMAIESLQREEAEEKGWCHRIRPKNVEVVVRCKDCRHRDLFSCPLADNDFQKDEDFCSWGERKGGEDE